MFQKAAAGPIPKKAPPEFRETAHPLRIGRARSSAGFSGRIPRSVRKSRIRDGGAYGETSIFREEPWMPPAACGSANPSPAVPSASETPTGRNGRSPHRKERCHRGSSPNRRDRPRAAENGRIPSARPRTPPAGGNGRLNGNRPAGTKPTGRLPPPESPLSGLHSTFVPRVRYR